jgi:hypothetical protein
VPDPATDQEPPPPFQDHPPWLLRVLSPNGDTDQLLGGALLVARNFAVTCAHAVNEALGQKREDIVPEPPGEERTVTLLTPDDQRHEATVVREFWHSGIHSSRDLALLRLRTPMSRETHLPRLRYQVAPESPLRLCGFPEGYSGGFWLTLSYQGRAGGAGGFTHQADVEGLVPAEEGFSGCPVFTHEGEVVGIASQARRQDGRAVFLLPVGQMTGRRTDQDLTAVPDLPLEQYLTEQRYGGRATVSALQATLDSLPLSEVDELLTDQELDHWSCQSADSPGASAWTRLGELLDRPSLRGGRPLPLIWVYHAAMKLTEARGAVPQAIWAWLRAQFPDQERPGWDQRLEHARRSRLAATPGVEPGPAPRRDRRDGSPPVLVVDVDEGGTKDYRISYALIHTDDTGHRLRPGPIAEEVWESDVARHIVDVAHRERYTMPREDGSWNRIRIVLPERLLKSPLPLEEQTVPLQRSRRLNATTVAEWGFHIRERMQHGAEPGDTTDELHRWLIKCARQRESPWISDANTVVTHEHPVTELEHRVHEPDIVIGIQGTEDPEFVTRLDTLLALGVPVLILGSAEVMEFLDREVVGRAPGERRMVDDLPRQIRSQAGTNPHIRSIRVFHDDPEKYRYITSWLRGFPLRPESDPD